MKPSLKSKLITLGEKRLIAHQESSGFAMSRGKGPMARSGQEQQQEGPIIQQTMGMSLAIGTALMAEQYRQDGCADKATLAKKIAGDLMQLEGITPGVASGFIDSLPTALGCLGSMPSSSGGASSSSAPGSAVFSQINMGPGEINISVAQQPQQQHASRASAQVGPQPKSRAIKPPVCAMVNADCPMKLQLGSNHMAKNCRCYCSHPPYHTGPHSFEGATTINPKRRCRPVNLNGHT